MTDLGPDAISAESLDNCILEAFHICPCSSSESSEAHNWVQNQLSWAMKCSLTSPQHFMYVNSVFLQNFYWDEKILRLSPLANTVHGWMLHHERIKFPDAIFRSFGKSGKLLWPRISTFMTKSKYSSTSTPRMSICKKSAGSISCLQLQENVR